MKALTGEWISKAEGDFATAQRELQAPESPNYDAACFHAQQCAEKYLKARLVEAGVSFPKTHDLGVILNILCPIEPAWEQLRDDLNDLTDSASEVRYPGFFAEASEAHMAIKAARKVRQIVRSSLGLD